MKEIATVAATCADCSRMFSHPSFGDFSYGEAILSTPDGRHFATVDAFDVFPRRVADLTGQGPFWMVLASLADPIAGQRLTAFIHCLHCGSRRLACWSGHKTGAMLVPAATFAAAAALSEDSLSAYVAALMREGWA